jgi:stage V sporulation protein S
LEVLKVSSKSNPNSCAGALAGVLRQHGQVEVQVVGAGALNQAIKAVAIARGFVADSGLDVICVPTFADIEIDGESRTAIRLLVEYRQRRRPVPLYWRGAAGARGVAVAGHGAVDGHATGGSAPATTPVNASATTGSSSTAPPPVPAPANASAAVPPPPGVGG